MKNKTNKELIREAILSGQFSSVEGKLKEIGVSLYDSLTGKVREWADIVDDIAQKWDSIK